MSGEILLNPGKIRVITARILHPYRGVWLADLELDPDELPSAPLVGKVSITINAPTPITLQGTIDPRGSGGFVEFYHLRVLGGGAGWDRAVVPKDYQADAGLTSKDVYATTAAEVGETVEVAISAPVARFIRTAGPARRVLDYEPSWYLDLAGVTQVGPRPAANLDASATLIRWDPTTEVAELTCDTLVMPGTSIADPRIPSGPVTVRDVEQTFDAAGSHVIAWCGSIAVGGFLADLRSMVNELAGTKFLASYQYRIVQQNSDGRLQLQPVDKTLGLPDALPVPCWVGLSGASAKYLLGSYVAVRFFGGDARQPVIDLYQPGVLPLEATVDATAAVHVGPSAASVAIAGGATPVVPTPWASALATALAALAGSLSAFTSGPLAPLGAVGDTLTTNLGALPSAATQKVKAT
jgi:hypothetical protein